MLLNVCLALNFTDLKIGRYKIAFTNLARLLLSDASGSRVRSR
jgi:hypothetical protein